MKLPQNRKRRPAPKAAFVRIRRVSPGLDDSDDDHLDIIIGAGVDREAQS
ncbi:MAG: hypothetical protein ACRECO_20610 [Xanthobacteraceae bacterium]